MLFALVLFRTQHNNNDTCAGTSVTNCGSPRKQRNVKYLPIQNMDACEKKVTDLQNFY